MNLENVMLSKISQTEKFRIIWYPWDIKPVATNGQKQTNQQKLIDTDNSVVATRGEEEWRLGKDKGGQVYGDAR